MTSAQEHGAREQRLRDAIDRGRAGDKVPMHDPAAAPLGTDDEAAGQRTSAQAADLARRQETGRPTAHSGVGHDANAADRNRPSRLPLLIMAGLFAAVAALAWWLA